METVQVDFTVPVPGGVEPGDRVVVTIDGTVGEDGQLDGVKVTVAKPDQATDVEG